MDAQVTGDKSTVSTVPVPETTSRLSPEAGSLVAVAPAYLKGGTVKAF